MDNNDKGTISDISLISDNVIQISVAHLGIKGPYWSIDKYYRYNLKTEQLTECYEGYSTLISCDE